MLGFDTEWYSMRLTPFLRWSSLQLRTSVFCGPGGEAILPGSREVVCRREFSTKTLRPAIHFYDFKSKLLNRMLILCVCVCVCEGGVDTVTVQSTRPLHL